MVKPAAVDESYDTVTGGGGGELGGGACGRRGRRTRVNGRVESDRV